MSKKSKEEKLQNSGMSSANKLKNYLQMIQFLDISTENYIYLCDIKNDRVYFTEKIRERFPIPETEGEGNSIEEWMSVVYSKDRAIVLENCRLVKNGEQKTYNNEYRLVDRDGIPCWVSSRGTTIDDENGQPSMMLGRVSELVVGHKVDGLTGLRSRDKFIEDMEQCLKENDGFLMILDVDDFKTVNIRNGRNFGNQLLKKITNALEQNSDYSLKLYRLDGDCFAVNFVRHTEEEVLRYYNAVKENLDGFCTISAGVVPYKAAEQMECETIYQYAESALDRAKKDGKNMLSFFSPDKYQKALEKIEILDEIEAAVQDGCRGFSLYYQPQINTQDYSIYGAEVLLRYTSPSKGAISPIEFIPMLEQNGLICPVGEWVLKNALEQCKEWRKIIPDFHISVNMSYVQLKQEEIESTILNLLKEADLPGEVLTLEVTESMQLQDYRYFNKIFYEWKAHGIKISIDDFGTGYSSLSYLKSIEIDEIKIDRCFVNRVQYNAYNYRLLSNMIELAHSAEIKVCCEGVETEEELGALKELHADLQQGYLFSKPCPKEEFEQAYIYEEAKDYQERKEKESYFRRIGSSESKKFLEEIRKEKIANITESVEEMVYVGDADTHELYYMNAAGRQITGQYDYKGKKCYEVLQGKTEPCEFCTNKKLCTDKFQVWETNNDFLGRHFIIKDRLIQWQGKKARLGIAIDITEREIVSRSVQKKLDFKDAIVEACKLIIGELDLGKCAQGVAKIIGKICQSDRAYILKQNKNDERWDLCGEWDAPGKEPIKERFPSCLEQAIEPENGCVVTAPIIKEERVLGYICVDHPRYTEAKNDLLETIADFMGYRIQEAAAEERIRELRRFHYEDIFDNTDLALWILLVDPRTGQKKLYGDRVWNRLMEMDASMSPEQRYECWFSRIGDGYQDYMKQAAKRMFDTGKVIQTEYTGNLPTKGEMTFQCTGVLVGQYNGMLCLEGYIRTVNNMERSNILPKGLTWDEFEYNDKKKSVYFHTERELIAGNQKKEVNFPECWIESEIVHPHYAEKWRSIFQNMQTQDEERDCEMVLKSKKGSYEWFKVRIRRIGSNNQEGYTTLVVVEPMDAERALKLECMRKMDFYEAMLSETVAYAEVDVESGHITRAGGLWKHYEIEGREKSQKYEELIYQNIQGTIYAEDEKEYRKCVDLGQMRQMFEQGVYTKRYCFRRLIDNEMYWMELVTHIFQNQYTGNTYALLYLKNVDAEKKRELAQETAAKTDSLTKVYNRGAFDYEVVQFMKKEKKNPRGALIMLDLDNFKLINDTYGHLKGDDALRKLAKILKTTFRRQDLVGRLGGDEFAVFVKGVTDKEFLNQKMEEMYEKLKQIEGVSLACSAGISLIEDKDFVYSEALGNADVALYESKNKGKNQYGYF